MSGVSRLFGSEIDHLTSENSGAGLLAANDANFDVEVPDKRNSQLKQKVAVALQVALLEPATKDAGVPLPDLPWHLKDGWPRLTFVELDGSEVSGERPMKKLKPCEMHCGQPSTVKRT